MSLETVAIALGSNMHNPIQQVEKTIDEICALNGIVILKASCLYETKPIGPEQPNFINAVILVLTSLPPLTLLNELLVIEEKRGRVRTRKWGPRIIDCDILFYGDKTIELPTLKVPHPEMKKRPFVLIPLQEVNPEYVFPDGVKISELVQDFNAADCIRLAPKQTQNEVSDACC